MLWAHGVVGLEPDGGAKFADCTVVIVFDVAQDRTEVGVGLGEVGLEPDRGAVFGGGLVELPLGPQGESEVGVGRGGVGPEPDRGAVLRDGRIELPLGCSERR